tara:strand:- start:83 stop:628 length:546 start_codon:yes stop_codon:yes gene_type:complete
MKLTNKINNMKETIKFKNVSIYVTGANGEQHLYHENNEYKNQSKEDIINIFKLEPLHYATHLDGIEVGTFKSFNTYNWGAPFTLCGVASEEIYEGVALVNIHLGGDARGNYSEAYICEEPEAIFSQNSYLDIELTNGEIYGFDCDNSEAYFNFNTLDAYYIDFEKELTSEQLIELEELKNN